MEGANSKRPQGGCPAALSARIDDLCLSSNKGTSCDTEICETS
jgi:hypothetical protein